MQKVTIELTARELKLLKYLTNQKISNLNKFHEDESKLSKDYSDIVSKLDKAKKDFK